MTEQKSIVVLVSGNGSNLQAIIDDISQHKINAKISAVIANQESAYALTRAENAGIPALYIDHKSFASREEYDAKMASCIDEFKPNLIVLAGFMRILTPSFVEHFQGRMLNIHPSLLPKYKGLHTHQRAIDAGDKEHGASVHFVTPELDGGPVVLQSKVPVFEQQDEQELADRVQQQERQMYPLVIKWFCEDRLKMINNRAVLDNQILAEEGYAIG
ncbi:phosphoribosylglycinamide formyltransferase [Paraglaciecola arctica]|uniref:Phosphoribosylglycinamide formyltransferase n=1 Tax=Paraglaciecola arctica BSs20135 TaxID=493475 RepID=K6YJJ9_9ALTE|nr:phosphoribosylglycinamide formyltransferase [Paraglaciecola arctica]GAC18332.1 phosphoribosylglycinamide formyltransferase 1 [Paraglaciecola arctica BSs20135]